MIISDSIVKAIFLKRLNRFSTLVDINGSVEKAHLPNSGRLGELLVPGVEAVLVHRPGDHRVTHYDLAQVYRFGRWIGTDARLPNALAVEAITQRAITELAGYSKTETEVTHGNSRFDLRLSHDDGTSCMVEVKSVTLVRDGCAMFPDAPTTRGARHVRELAGHVRSGGQAAVLFIIQRSDADVFTPNSETDEPFVNACVEAAEAGVMFLAYRCETGPGWITVSRRIPVILPG